jgi:hypothetical protein
MALYYMNEGDLVLPDFGECHIRIDVFQSALMPQLHRCEFGKGIFLCCVRAGVCQLGVHLHGFEFLLDRNYQAIERFKVRSEPRCGECIDNFIILRLRKMQFIRSLCKKPF